MNLKGCCFALKGKEFNSKILHNNLKTKVIDNESWDYYDEPIEVPDDFIITFNFTNKNINELQSLINKLTNFMNILKENNNVN